MVAEVQKEQVRKTGLAFTFNLNLKGESPGGQSRLFPLTRDVTDLCLHSESSAKKTERETYGLTAKAP